MNEKQQFHEMSVDQLLFRSHDGASHLLSMSLK